MEQLKAIIESLLFVTDSPLTLDHLKRALPDALPDAIKKALFDLMQEYTVRDGGFLLHEVAGGYQFRTKKEFKEPIRRLFQPTLPRLSSAAMETLAIIAYRQPILRSEIDQIRGVNSGNSLRILLERKLIRVLGRREIPGRPLVYATTRKFLETFDLKDLKDLPTPKEIEGMEIKTLAAPEPKPIEISADEPDEKQENIA